MTGLAGCRKLLGIALEFFERTNQGGFTGHDRPRT
jgi:hypothetical protein